MSYLNCIFMFVCVSLSECYFQVIVKVNKLLYLPVLLYQFIIVVIVFVYLSTSSAFVFIIVIITTLIISMIVICYLLYIQACVCLLAIFFFLFVRRCVYVRHNPFLKTSILRLSRYIFYMIPLLHG